MKAKPNKKKSKNINWDKLRDKLLEKFPSLTERDLNFEEGKMNEMLGKLQTKLGKTKKEIFTLLSTL